LSGHFRLIRELPAGTSFLKKLITIAEFFMWLLLFTLISLRGSAL
jgi:hypothetical protein